MTEQRKGMRMAETPRSRETKGLDGQEFTRARPAETLPVNPADLSWTQVMDYAAQAAKWIMEQCMEKTALTREEALARQIETRNVAELQRTIERMKRFRKEHLSEEVTKKSDDDYSAELLASLDKVAHP